MIRNEHKHKLNLPLYHFSSTIYVSVFRQLGHVAFDLFMGLLSLKMHYVTFYKYNFLNFYRSISIRKVSVDGLFFPLLHITTPPLRLIP